MASKIFDLPEPFSPVMALNSESQPVITVRVAYDLKPSRIISWMYIATDLREVHLLTNWRLCRQGAFFSLIKFPSTLMASLLPTVLPAVGEIECIKMETLKPFMKNINCRVIVLKKSNNNKQFSIS